MSTGAIFRTWPQRTCSWYSKGLITWASWPSGNSALTRQTFEITWGAWPAFASAVTFSQPGWIRLKTIQMLVFYYPQPFSLSSRLNIPRTNVRTLILCWFMPFSIVSLRDDIVYHRQNTICKGSILNVKSINEFIKVSTIFEVPVNLFEHTATISPILFMIKAIEMVKHIRMQWVNPKLTRLRYYMRRVNPFYRVDPLSKSELTRLAGLPHFR